jgi:cyclophilin family peptidyl-prolyl cis-trans isomerase
VNLKLRAGILCLAVLLAGCTHHQPSSVATRAPVGDSALTGERPQPFDSMKTPPRATLVALPPTAPAVTIATETNNAPAADAAPTAPADNAGAMAANGSAPDDSQPPPALTSTSPSSTNITDSPGAMSASSSPAPDASEAGASPAPGSEMERNAPNPYDDGVDTNEGPVAVVQTDLGQIVIELDEFAAPKTCKNFRQLITDGFYNNTVFHRVIPNFIIQGGDPNTKSSATDRNIYGLGSPGYTLPSEIELKHDRGAVAMARLPDSVNPQRESNGSQFYICLQACPTLDDQYTVFGHVIKGLDVAERIAQQPRDSRDNPLKRIEMTVTMEPREQALSNTAAASP